MIVDNRSANNFSGHRVSDSFAIVVRLPLDEPFLLHPLRFFAKELVTGNAFSNSLLVTRSFLFETVVGSAHAILSSYP